MSGGSIFQKPISPKKADFMTRPSPGTINPGNTAAHASIKAYNPIGIGDDGMVFGMDNYIGPIASQGAAAYTPGQPTLDSEGYEEAQGIYERAEARRQEKLDAMAGMAQGKGGGGGGVSGQIVGDGGDLNIQHTPMERGKDGFPTLADFEQPLHTFMGKRKLNLKGYV